MRTHLLTATLGLASFLASNCPLQGQIAHGSIREGEILKSKVLDRQIEYSVYLPYDYDTSNRRYPVVYLLHGHGDDDAGWVQFGEVALIADEAIAKREITPMIIAMPDAGLSFYIDNLDGSVRYEEFLINEFLPHFEQEYRVRPTRRYRGLAGLSMGGYGALVHGLRHPDLFSGLAAFSAAIYSDEGVVAMPDEEWSRLMAAPFGPDLVGEQRLTAHYRAHSPIELARTLPTETLHSLRIYFDCGDGDDFTIGNAQLHIALRERRVPHEYRVRDGTHTWSYWRSGLVEGLKFLTAGFHQP